MAYTFPWLGLLKQPLNAERVWRNDFLYSILISEEETWDEC